MQNCGVKIVIFREVRVNLGKLKNLGSLMSAKSTLAKLPNFSNLTKKANG